MKVTGTIEMGNGEKCPFCKEILDDRVKGKEIQNHLFKKHEKELLKRLFPKKNVKEDN